MKRLPLALLTFVCAAFSPLKAAEEKWSGWHILEPEQDVTLEYKTRLYVTKRKIETQVRWRARNTNGYLVAFEIISPLHPPKPIPGLTVHGAAGTIEIPSSRDAWRCECQLAARSPACNPCG